jgi:hypothetical protein
MIRPDMEATLRVADRLAEVIIFRSTGPWSKRWIERGYPTKNFHVKGKSSDWGPQAGFVPYEGKYSKVGADNGKADAGTRANKKGIDEGYADTTYLELTFDELRAQNTRPEENPARVAVQRMVPMRTQTRNYHLFATRGGDNRVFPFRAIFNAWKNKYMIYTLDETLIADEARLERSSGRPMKVMTSSEVGANNRPMTGDYDLMAVCPLWRNYMSVSTEEISKRGVVWSGERGQQPGQTFATGSRMDAVLDMRVNTGAVGRNGRTFQGYTVDNHNVIHRGDEVVGDLEEHGDMGNLTPRILRCINALNQEMNPTNGDTPFRRVHHNAESHRNAMFGALTAKDMWDKDDGFPMTAFHPATLHRTRGWVYGDVATLESMAEFQVYAQALHEAGYYVPRNWTWGMSVRDRVKQWERGH